MADDPTKKREDGWFVSKQSHEYNYFKGVIKKEFPGAGDEAIENAIATCRKEIQPSEGREKLTECVRKKLGGGPGGARDDRPPQPDRRHG
jgi:hypothetical protein